MKRTGRNRWAGLLMLVLLCAAVVAAPRQLRVQVREAHLRPSPSYLTRPVGSVAYAEAVTVLGHRGAWFEVRAPSGEEGWLHESALTDRRVELRPGRTASGAASEDELVLAGRGFAPDVERALRQSGRPLDYAWIDRMEDLGVSAQTRLAFIEAGGLKRGEASR